MKLNNPDNVSTFVNLGEFADRPILDALASCLFDVKMVYAMLNERKSLQALISQEDITVGQLRGLRNLYQKLILIMHNVVPTIIDSKHFNEQFFEDIRSKTDFDLGVRKE